MDPAAAAKAYYSDLDAESHVACWQRLYEQRDVTWPSTLLSVALVSAGDVLDAENGAADYLAPMEAWYPEHFDNSGAVSLLRNDGSGGRILVAQRDAFPELFALRDQVAAGDEGPIAEQVWENARRTAIRADLLRSAARKAENGGANRVKMVSDSRSAQGGEQ